MDKRVQTQSTLLFVFLSTWAILISRVGSTISYGDSGELALAGATLGVAHSPGYPVFVLLNHMLSGFFYFGNVAYHQNLMSLFFVAAGLCVLGYSFSVLGSHRGFALLPLMFLVSPLLKEQSFVTEVFPLTFFWATLLLFTLIKFSSRRGGLFLLCFLMGIGFAVHQTLLLLLPGLLYYLFQNREHIPDLNKKSWPFFGLFLLLGLSVNLYLPFRAMSNPFLNWEDPRTMSRFWGVITRARYGFLQLAQGEVSHSISLGSIWKSFGFAIGKIKSSFGMVGLLFFILITVLGFSKKELKKWIILSWILFICTGPFFFWVSNSPQLAAETSLVDRFCLLPLLVCFTFIGIGFMTLWNSKKGLTQTLLILFILIFISGGGKTESPRFDLSLREIGMNAFRQMPPQAILFSDRADEFEFVTAFLQGAEKRRTDLNFIDCNAGVSKSIYGSDYYRIWGRERLKIRESVEGTILKKNPNRVYYATIDPTMINIYRTSRGFLFKAWPLDQILDLKSFPWNEILSWRFHPQSERGQGLLISLWQLLANDLFEANYFDSARQMFGLMQVSGADQRDVQMGFLYQKRSQYGQAKESYREALKSRIPSEALYVNLGTLLMWERRNGEAKELFERGLKNFSESKNLRLNLAQIYWGEGNNKGVIQMVSPILETDPNHPEAMNLYLKARGMERIKQNREKFAQEQPPIQRRVVPEPSLSPQENREETQEKSDYSEETIVPHVKPSLTPFEEQNNELPDVQGDGEPAKELPAPTEAPAATEAPNPTPVP